jgi:hypothetical protein
MPAGSGKFRRWQQLAEKARFAAERMDDPQARQIILGVALAYECLADGARKQELRALIKKERKKGRDKLN